MVRVLVTSTDVIHSWFMPAFGVQEYAVIGRLNESWFNVEREGTYYGQCNQICGVNHAFMPIKIEAVSKDDFQRMARPTPRRNSPHDATDGAALRRRRRPAPVGN